MGIFDKRPDFSVQFDGDEYIRFLDYKEEKKNKKKLTKNQKQGAVILLLCGIGMLLVIGLVDHVTYTPPPEGVISQWFDAAPVISNMPWNGIGKVFVVYAAPILVFIIGLSWIIHGVQLRILA